MTMPSGGVGIDGDAWNAEWNTTRTVQGANGSVSYIPDLRNLHSRTRDNITEYYKGQIAGPGANSPIAQLVSFVDSIIPDWLDPIKDALIWIAGKITGGFQLLWDAFVGLFEWINDNVGVPVLQAIFEFLDWVWTKFDQTSETVLKPIVEFASWVWTSVGGVFDPIGQKIINPFLTGMVEFLKWLWETFEETAESVLKPLATWLKWLWDEVGSKAETLLKPVVLFVEWVFSQFGSTVSAVTNGVEGLLKPFFQFITWVWNNFGNAVESFMKPVIQFLSWLWTSLGHKVETFMKPVINWLNWLWTSFGSRVESFLKPMFNFLSWVWTNFGNAVESFMKPVVQFLRWLWTSFGSTVETFLKPLLNAFKGVFDTLGSVNIFNELGKFFGGIVSDFGSLSQWLSNIPFIGALVSAITGIQNGTLNTIKTFFSGFSGTASLISQIVKGITGSFGALADLANYFLTHNVLFEIIQTLTGAVVNSLSDLFQAVADWTADIPFVGPLTAGLTGQWVNPETGTNNTFPDLIAWAGELLGINSSIPARNLEGPIPSSLLAQIGVGSIGDYQPNLIEDQSFELTSSVTAGSGWSHDSTVNFPGSLGGAAKVVGNGGVKRLYSNAVAVSQGQLLALGTAVRWTKKSSATPTIGVAVRGFDNGTVKFTTNVGTITAKSGGTVSDSAARYTQSSGTAATYNNNGWVTVGGQYSVPAGVTHICMVLSVTNAPTGTTVWFDEVVMRKVSLLSQGLVSGLRDDLDGVITASEYQEILDSLAKKSGATTAEAKSAIQKFLTGDSTLNGSKITAGQIAWHLIPELGDTWDEIYKGITGSYPATKNPATAAQALDEWKTVIGNNGSVILSTARENDKLKSQLKSLDSTITGLKKQIKDLQLKNGVVTSTVPVLPVIATAYDDFERASLGSTWTVSNQFNDGSVLQIRNYHDAYFKPPAVSVFQNKTVAIFKGKDKVSKTEYQKISATLGSKGSIPLLGTVGYNDLIARATNGLNCVICRFFANGTVRFYYRNGSWTERQFGSFQAPAQPTTGSLIEFYCGTKSKSDQTRCYAKIGTAVIGPCFISSSVISKLGKGWGFGGGNGLSFVAPQPGAILNYWGAQDQL